MKTCYFWATPSGPINLIEGDKMPVRKPERSDFYATDQDGGRIGPFYATDYQKALDKYEAALQAAKESSVPIQDRERAKKMIELLLYEKRKELTFQDISSLDVMANVIYGPFTVEYEIRKKCRYSGDCPDSSLGLFVDKIAILYDDTPEKEKHSIRCASYTSEALEKRGHIPGKCDCRPAEKEPQEDQHKASKLKLALQDKIKEFEAYKTDPRYQSEMEQNAVAVTLRELRYLDSIVEYE